MIKNISKIAAITVFWYLCVAFINFELNPGSWESVTRTVLVLLLLFSYFMMFVVHHMERE